MGAEFSPCRRYRYALTRESMDMRVGQSDRTLVMIGHNPSTADEVMNDNTIRRCIGFANDNGFRNLVMVNLFAFRATVPYDVPMDEDAIGPDNDAWLTAWMMQGDTVCCAWGGIEHPIKAEAVERVRRIAELTGKPLHCLGVTKYGEPRHPLYMPKDSQLMEWKP